MSTSESVTPVALRPADRFAVAMLVAGAAGIATSPILVRLSELGPTATGVWRLAAATLPLWIWMRLERSRPKEVPHGRARDHWPVLLVACLCLAGDLFLWHWSIFFTSIANSTLLANLAPVFVTAVAVLVFKERVGALFYLGLAFSLAGSATLSAGSAGLRADGLFGDGLALGAAACYGGYILAVSRLRRVLSTATIMTWVSFVTALMLLPVAVASGESLVPTTLGGLAVLLGLAWFAHFGGQSLITQALAHLPASFSSVGLLLQPVLAAIIAWILFNEAIGLPQIAGGALVLSGILICRKASRHG